MIFYTNWFIPARFQGTTYGPFVFIRPSKRDDVGLREHELTHVRQFWANPFFGLAYLFSKEARLRYEAEAYREQLKYSPGKEQVFAWLLVNKYNLDITEKQALKALNGN